MRRGLGRFPESVIELADGARQAHPAQARLPTGQVGEGDADRAGASGAVVGRMDSGMTVTVHARIDASETPPTRT